MRGKMRSLRNERARSLRVFVLRIEAPGRQKDVPFQYRQSSQLELGDEECPKRRKEAGSNNE